MIRVLLIVMVASFVLGPLIIRILPVNTGRWHQAFSGALVDDDTAIGAVRILRGGAAAFEDLDRIIRATPRTRPIAGDLYQGRVTYETRSVYWGFPDYTTVEGRGADLIIRARAAMGQSDFGVNRQRVSEWLAALTQTTGS